ncbi:hypothetical protein HYH03_016015 [Edaphochlamys debaryana]|uniref:Uncharacterized protein n=1 Tax=Edaphochlamys debaryana TaxID=47281 RepID=A0A836BRV6_9CHLO|nr:hypothetical protein HYH03_016015 [Edaphochlamys debaryana]|eukprot:KAG2485229.1 hypothetical protein HYH03_016015 [Edaphochlamys debaryana]
MKLRALHRGTRALAAARGDGDAASSTSAPVNAASSAQRNDMPEYGAVLAAVRSSLDHSGEESEDAWWDATRLAAAATSTSGRRPAAAARRAAVATPAAVSSGSAANLQRGSGSASVSTIAAQ